MKDIRPVDKRGKVFCRDDLMTMYLYVNILRLTNKMRGPIAEYMFENFPYFILRDEMWEGLVGEGSTREEGIVGGGLGKCLVQDGIVLTVFVVEVLSHRRYYKVRKGLGWINIVELQKNKV